MANNNTSDDALKELVEKIHQFLAHQAENNHNLTDSVKESLTLANEFIEQAYNIEKKPPSNELLDIYKRNTRQQDQQSFTSSTTLPNIGATLVQNLANTILSQATAGATARSTGTTTDGAQGTQQQSADSNPLAQAAAMAQQIFGAAAAGISVATTTSTDNNPSATTASSNQNPSTQAAPREPKARKKATEAEKLAAESFKNQGNDLMKQDKFQEAMDCYSEAISIDENNAIFYSNRAAAKSKLGDHNGALADCQEAIEIDPTYSKAYGRMGLAYASLENHRNAKEAYQKAVELDPTNQSYRNNLQIAEEKLAESANSATASGPGGRAGNDLMSMVNSLMNNPQVMQMAMRSLQDPRMQNLFSNLGANLGGGTGNTGSGGGNSNNNNDNNRQPPDDHYS